LSHLPLSYRLKKEAAGHHCSYGDELVKASRGKGQLKLANYLSAGAAKAAVGARARFERLDCPERRLCDRDDDQLRETL
jgi:hypothetical protein